MYILYPQEVVLISVRGCVDLKAIVWLEGLGQSKNPMTSGIKPPTTLHYCMPFRDVLLRIKY
jgi:hypothetical protein